MRFSQTFYRTAAVCSLISAVTTLMLIFLPEFYAPAPDFAGRMHRVIDPYYRLRSWVYLIHPFLVLMAALGIGMQIRRVSSTATVVGLLGFTLWAFTEAGQQTLTLFAFDRWRLAWLAGDEALRAGMPTLTILYDGLWDAMYFLLLLGFAIGNATFGAVLIRDRGLTRIVGAFLLAAFGLTFFANIASELRWFVLPEPFASLLYPAIQPLGRTLIGVWLWRGAASDAMTERAVGH